MDEEQQHAAKRQVASFMQQGISWKEATATVGIHISRSTAYRWLEAWRRRKEAALQDGRHGHPAKLREPVLTFLETMLKSAPEIPSREVQAALHKQFGISVSIGHLNHVRSQLGLGSRAARRKKNCSSHIHPSNAQNSMV